MEWLDIMDWLGPGALAAGILYFVTTYNGLVSLRARAGQAHAERIGLMSIAEDAGFEHVGHHANCVRSLGS